MTRRSHFAPLGLPRRKAAKRPEKICMTPGCGAKIKIWQWLCDRCFGELPGGRKKEICDARRARQFERIFGLSKSAAEFLFARRVAAADK